MADVKEFNLDGTPIDVKDTVARNAASQASFGLRGPHPEAVRVQRTDADNAFS